MTVRAARDEESRVFRTLDRQRAAERVQSGAEAGQAAAEARALKAAKVGIAVLVGAFALLLWMRKGVRS